MGGTPPYRYYLESSPPNPPGTQLILVGVVARVITPGGTPHGAVVTVFVTDSSDPEQVAAGSFAVG